jgi:hypothetical protein
MVAETIARRDRTVDVDDRHAAPRAAPARAHHGLDPDMDL